METFKEQTKIILSSGQKVEVEFNDGTIWAGVIQDKDIVIIDDTEDYRSYYEFNYHAFDEEIQLINYEYQLKDVCIVSIL
jgi:hypothetical protein